MSRNNKRHCVSGMTYYSHNPNQKKYEETLVLTGTSTWQSMTFFRLNLGKPRFNLYYSNTIWHIARSLPFQDLSQSQCQYNSVLSIIFDVGDSVCRVRRTTYNDAKSSCAPRLCAVRRSAAAADLITVPVSIGVYTVDPFTHTGRVRHTYVTKLSHNCFWLWLGTQLVT